MDCYAAEFVLSTANSRNALRFFDYGVWHPNRANSSRLGCDAYLAPYGLDLASASR